MEKQNRFFLLIVILLLIDVQICQAARVTGDQVVLYTFKEGNGTTVNDVSGFGSPLNLTIASEAAVSWIPGGGLSVDASTIIESGVASTKVIDSVKVSNEMTFEAWIKPANTTQGGPARIVTISLNTSLRNFTLAQQANTYDVRLRTTSTSLNGMPSVSTPAGSLTTNLTHVVYTRDVSGAANIYIDGNEVANGNIDGNCSNWDDSYNLALANELTIDRAWLGEIYLVAIYGRALTEPEVDQNFMEGAILECNVDGDCDDSNSCTDDTCVDYECQYTNNASACDDGLFCNGNDTCSGGSCSIHAGNPCPETECNTCQETTDSCFDPVGSACTDDGNVCTDDQCDGTGSCIHPNNNAPCDDGLFCNGNDLCGNGSCSFHTGTPCPETECNTCQEDTDSCFDPAGTVCIDDGNVCTDDQCNGTGSCIHPNNNDPCDDGLFCNGNDTCSGGSCSIHAGNPCLEIECNTCQEDIDSCFDPAGTVCNGDGNGCTDDVCSGTGACIHPNNNAPCDDGLFCNGLDICSGGSCSFHTGNPCPGTECNTCREATDSCFDPAGTACTDDGNVCTDDQCNGIGVCEHPNNTVPCDDGLYCNGADTCSGGSCAVHAGDPCPGTECNTCQEATDSCSDPAGTACTDDGNVCTDDQCNGIGACEHPNNTIPCDDSIPCTEVDTCSGGACNGTPNNTLCSDGNICTDDICTAGVGCSNPNNTASCDDGLYCNGADTCGGGSCSVHAGDPCPATECNICQEVTESCFDPAGTACTDDGNVCTDDQCNGIGVCEHPNNTASCDDGLYCNGTDTCGGGSCSVHAGDPCPATECNTCQEVTESCFDPAGTACTDDGNVCTDNQCNGIGVCEHLNNNTPCDDLIACTEVDTCSGGTCNGTPNNTLCFDDNICTDDICMVGVGCSNPHNTYPCDDSIYCNGSDYCSGGSCRIHTGDPCLDDEEFCTGVEYCDESNDICKISGDPCGQLLCDESDDFCIDSTASLIVMDSFDNPGTIQIALKNLEDEISLVQFDLCDPEGHGWLKINNDSCELTDRVPQGISSACTIIDSESNDGCLTITLSIETTDFIQRGSGPIIELSYFLNPIPLFGEVADLIPKNIDVRDISDESLNITPLPGTVGFKCQNDENCNDYNDCTDDVCNNGTCEYEEINECEQPMPCTINIEPETASLVSEQALSLTVTEVGDCKEPSLEWSIQSDIGGTIEQNGDYIAGINIDCSQEIIETVQLVDYVNGIAAEADITVSCDRIKKVINISNPLWVLFQNDIYSSHWLPFPHVLLIFAEQGNFDPKSSLDFEPAGFITTLYNIGRNNIMIALVLVEPNAQEGPYRASVTTGSHLVTKKDALMMHMMPFILDEEINF